MFNVEDAFGGEPHTEKVAGQHNDTGVNNALTHVAFSVGSRNTTLSGVTDMDLGFEITYFNIGGGWKKALKAFQAPVRGKYQFIASIDSDIFPLGSTRCHLKHSSLRTGHVELLSLQKRDSVGDKSIFRELERGDCISIQIDKFNRSTKPWQNIFSTFSGYFIPEFR